MSEIQIVCHRSDPHILGCPSDTWRKGFTPGAEPPLCDFNKTTPTRHFSPFQPYRTCSYCGSLHPEDLLTVLKAGARLGGSDWKYGWPHKFYVHDAPNPFPDVPVVIGHESRWDDDRQQRIETCEAPRPAGPTLQCKWYNEHFLDIQGTELFTTLQALIEEKAHIRFEFVDGKLRYTAPYRGYQA